ncbi:P-loop containing nucleoside triphosphate hydrolase [Arabidopsis suecica]|uniref:P-loop containing nucleoside triphosphate hydrolase n=1 Tax=Arabidopsis suecica TaxID=45249 RepID=A0A8T2BPC6_ARASU|nr:P-loop containing nucleoside triphosphate hydrolase [Arabidopsis suecica]
MAEAIVSFGVEKLWELVSQEYERLQGVGEQITELKSDLNMLMSFLNDADEKKQTSALARNCVEEVKEITYDAEDIIQTFILKAKQRNGIKNQMRSLACIQGGRRKTALEITSISKRISKVIHVMQTFNIKSDIMNCGYSQALMDKERETRHTFPIESESNLVGLEKNVEKLVEELVGDDSSHGVSITGLGGLGKTTLARQVFNHGRVKGHFDGLAWVCVSQDFTRKDVWQTILWSLSPGDKNPEMKEDEIQKKLVLLLETKKVLIVFDDVWKRNDWDTIKPMFPERKAAGWKVLLTSRNNDVHPQCVTFKPELLTHDECWKLLQMIAFPKNDTPGYIIDEEMVKMAEEMVKHCGRLPLAVKVLGGLLAAQHTPRQWKIISENIKPHIVGGIDDDSSSVNHVLSLSFEGLPSYLKHCLLHLASYPEDYRISLEDVSYIWAAEGITKPRHYEGATIRDVSDVYIEELVKRNMVISERDMVTSRFEVCQLHDLMREICLLKAKEESFLQIVTDPACSSSVHSEASSRSRRLVVYIATTERAGETIYTRTFNGERVIKNSKLRSLLFFPVDEVARFFMGSYFMELQLLRVLDLTRANFKGWKVPSTIGKLIHLKYLSLYKAYVAHLPSSIRNLKSLLYLNLGLGYGDCHVPNVLKEMQELRYLCLPRFTHKKTKLELGGLLKLETLRNFSTKDSSVKDLHHMTRLRNLSISIDGWSVEMLSSTLSKLSRHLENLTIEDDTNGRKGIHMPRLPNVQHFPSHLTTIYLEHFRLEEDPMPILEKLLQLKEVKLLNTSFHLRRMVCSGGGFPKLQKLELFRLWEWEEWIVEEGSMPLLHTLYINECDKLKELPDRLRFITSLKELTIHTSEREFRKKVSKGGEDYYKIQHIPLIRYNWQPASEDKESD